VEIRAWAYISIFWSLGGVSGPWPRGKPLSNAKEPLLAARYQTNDRPGGRAALAETRKARFGFFPIRLNRAKLVRQAVMNDLSPI